MEEDIQLSDSSNVLSPSSASKKKKCGPKRSIYMGFFDGAKCSECGYMPKEKLTASNAKRHLFTFHSYLSVFNADPARLLALYAATTSMSLCHVENQYLKALLLQIPGSNVPSRRSLAGMVSKECDSVMMASFNQKFIL